MRLCSPPGTSEIRSWEHSLTALAEVLRDSRLDDALNGERRGLLPWPADGGPSDVMLPGAIAQVRERPGARGARGALRWRAGQSPRLRRRSEGGIPSDARFVDRLDDRFANRLVDRLVDPFGPRSPSPRYGRSSGLSLRRCLYASNGRSLGVASDAPGRIGNTMSVSCSDTSRTVGWGRGESVTVTALRAGGRPGVARTTADRRR
jgi:hypothetical protein